MPGKEPETSSRLALAANDSGAEISDPIDPRIRRIAEAIGRHLAREYMKLRVEVTKNASNDNHL
jgi:hypothetical protein